LLIAQSDEPALDKGEEIYKNRVLAKYGELIRFRILAGWIARTTFNQARELTMDWAKIAWFVILPLVAVGWLVDKFDIHIPFTRAGFVLTLASLVVGTLFVVISWFSNSPQTNKFGAAAVYGGLDLWILGVFVYWVVMG
jgi:hypothetical protein